MFKMSFAKPVELPKTYTDVLYLTDKTKIPWEVKRLFKQKNLSYLMLPVDKFPRIIHLLDLIGTVIIDAEQIDSSKQQKMGRIIESLESKNIGAVLLSSRVATPLKSFTISSAPLKSFSLTTNVEAFSVDELWTRISVNLAYRKKSSGIVVKPAGLPRLIDRVHCNKLAEQLSMAGALMGNLTEQLRMAGLVQRDFLPAQLPSNSEVQWAACFLPAEWVSGDIYDVMRIDEQHVGFYVADAVGHSMPAALLTIFLKQALVMRETIANNYRIYSPAEVMRNLNVRMAAQKLSGYQFATCCYCLLNTKTMQLTFSRAGHPYPVLIRGDQPPRQLEVRGPLLGIFEQAEFLQQTVQLQRGDKILLYSDGLEPFVGSFDDLTGYHFNDEFCQIKNLSVVQMFERLNSLVQSKKISSAEIDDVTAVGLEVL